MKKATYRNILWFFLLFSMQFIIFFKLWNNNEVFFAGDANKYYISRWYIVQQIKDGVFPFWSQYIMNGMPYAASLQGVYYPFTYLALFLPLKLFIYIYSFTHITLGGVFAGKFIGSLCSHKQLQYVMSLLYVLSIQLGGYRKNHPNLQFAFIWIPVLLYLVEKYLKEQQKKYVILLGLSMALQFMSGETGVQICAYTDIAVLAYFILRAHSNGLRMKKYLPDILRACLLYVALIAVQVLPCLQILSFYSSLGGENSSFDFFTSYSIHPVKLLQVVSPHILGKNNIYTAFGFQNSSEMDIELFIGTGCCILVMYSIAFLRKENTVKVPLIMMLFSFIYAAHAHIPFLSKLLFKIPIVENFRVASRILFIFVFFSYSCAIIAADHILTQHDFPRLKIIILINIFVIALCISAVLLLNTNSCENNLAGYIFYAFIIPIIFLGIYWLIIHICSKDNNASLLPSCFFPLSLLLLTIFQVWPFYSITSPEKVDKLQDHDEYSNELVKDIGYSDYWCAYPFPDGAMQYLYSGNRGSICKVSNINAYESFNHPGIYKLLTAGDHMQLNFSELLTGSIRAKDNIYQNNSMLSMLGVKYIEDPKEYINDDGSIPIFEGGKKLLQESSIQLTAADNDSFFLWQKEICISSNCYYKIELEARSDNDTTFYIDFFGGELYDSSHQQRNIYIEGGQNNTFQGYIDSENVPDCTIYFRIISTSEEPCEIINLTLHEATRENIIYGASPYKPYIVNDDIRIFENLNAQEILFSVPYVKQVESPDDIYQNVDSLDFINNAYLTDLPNSSYSQEVIIKNIDYENSNHISAQVESDSNSFIEFSQNYYPNWHAYIDGKETKIFFVNGVQQGIIVPRGNHTVEFKYEDTLTVILGTLGLAALMYALYTCIKESAKS